MGLLDGWDGVNRWIKVDGGMDGMGCIGWDVWQGIDGIGLDGMVGLKRMIGWMG